MAFATSKFRTYRLLQFFIALSFVFLFGLVFNAESVQAAQQAIDVSGTITETTEWADDGNSYVVQGVVTISSGVELTIKPGVVIKMDPNARFNIQGQLLAEGTADAPIVFTSLKDDSVGGDTNNDETNSTPAAGDWGGLYFGPTSSGNVLAHVEVRYAGQEYTVGPWNNSNTIQSSVYVDESDVDIQNSTVISGTGAGINVYQGSLNLGSGSRIVGMENGTASGQFGRGIYSRDAIAITLTDSTIEQNANTGLYVIGGAPPIISNMIFTSNAAAVYLNNVLLGAGSGNNVATGHAVNAIQISILATGQATSLLYSNLPYYISSLRVVDGATLTIPADQTIMFQPETSTANQSRFIVDGTLIAQGTEVKPIIFTSANDIGGNGVPAAGNWTGIYFGPTSSGSILEHVEVRYAGAAYQLSHNDPTVTGRTNNSPFLTFSSIYLDEGSSVSISNSKIYSGTGTGINVYKADLDLVNSNVSEMVSGTYTFGSNINYNYVGRGIYSYQSEGTTITGSRIEHNGSIGLHVIEGSLPIITNTTFDNNAGYPVYLQNVLLGVGSNNINASGNYADGIAISTASVGTNAALPTIKLPYFIGRLKVAEGETLTLFADQEFRSVPVVNTLRFPQIEIQGTLIANGEVDKPIVFTSSHDYTATNENDEHGTPAPKDWTGIYFGPNSSGNLLKHVEVRYAGAAYEISHKDPAISGGTEDITLSSIYIDKSDVNIQNSSIISGSGPGINVYEGRLTLGSESRVEGMQSGTHSYNFRNYSYFGTGVYVNKTDALDISRSSITDNQSHGIDFTTAETSYAGFNGIWPTLRKIAKVSDSFINNNGGFGIYNRYHPIGSPHSIEASDNWWGHNSGPEHATNSGGVGQKVTDGINFDPWFVVPTFDNAIELAIGEPTTFTMLNPYNTKFKVNPEPDRNLLVTVDLTDIASLDASSKIRLTANNDSQLASQTAYKFVEEKVTADEISFTLPNTLNRTYYILTSLPYTTEGSTPATILAEYIDFYINDVSPKQAGNTGSVTIQVQGAGFSSDISMSIISPSGKKIESTKIFWQDSDNISAKFELNEEEQGDYAIELSTPELASPYLESDAVSLIDGVAGHLKLDTNFPSDFLYRAGITYHVELTFRNAGVTDIVAPFIRASMVEPTAIIRSESGYLSEQGLTWLASIEEHPSGVIPVGASGSIKFRVTPRETTSLSYGILQEDSRAFDWESRRGPIGAFELTDSEWNQMRSELGEQNYEVYQNLRQLNDTGLGPLLTEQLLLMHMFQQFTAPLDEGYTRVKDYTYELAQEDVKLYYDRNTLFSTLNFDPNLPVIFLTHGWRSGSKNEKLIYLAERLKQHYQNEYNIVRVTWNIGAQTPLGCLEWACAHLVAPRIKSVGIVALEKMLQVGHTKWDESIYIGHSFGNGVNYEIANSYKIANPKDKHAKALILNGAEDWAYLLNPPIYSTGFGGRDTAIYTHSIGDDESQLFSERKIKYIEPDCNGSTCSEIGSHSAGPRLLLCLLTMPGDELPQYDDDGTPFSCGTVVQGRPQLAKALIENDWEALGISEPPVLDSQYTINALGQIADKLKKKIAGCDPFGVVCKTSDYVTNEVRRQKFEVVNSSDPNDKVGPSGVGNQQFVSSDEHISYLINFENVMTATAPVQELNIVDQLDPNLDWSTFEFGSIEYGGRIVPYDVQSGVLEFAHQDYPPSDVFTGTLEGQMRVDIEAKMDIRTGIIEWHLTTIDDATNDFPLDALAGILPPEDGTGRGQGYVTFSVKPKADVPEGTVIRNKASIIFDANEAIETNEVFNTIGDAVDLVVIDEVENTDVNVGETTTITYTVINDGPEPAADTELTVDPVTGGMLLSLSPAQGSCTDSLCALGTLGDGEWTTVVALYDTTPVTDFIPSLVSTVHVTSTLIEVNPFDNSTRSTLSLLGGDQFAPTLSVTEEIYNVVEGVISLPVEFITNSNSISSVGFSINYDQSCLTLDESDADASGFPDAVSGLPIGYVASISHDSTDADGELDISLNDQSEPLDALTDGPIAMIEFGVDPACASTDIEFSEEPPASFGNINGVSVAGMAISGTLTFNRAPTDLLLSADAALTEPLVGVDENSTEASVAYLASVDIDVADSHIYTLVAGEGDADNGLFSIDGNVLQSASFDFEAKNQYTIRVQTDDGRGGAFEKALTITVNDVNEAPLSVEVDKLTIDENQSAYSVVGDLSTSDPDQLDEHIYSIVDGEMTAFMIEEESLETLIPLNFEDRDSYTVTIRVTDLGGLFFEEEFTITVADINDAPIAVDDTIDPFDQVLTAAASFDILANDTDEDIGDSLAVNSVNSANVTNNGADITYTPPAGNGTENFEYVVTDGELTASALVTVTYVANDVRGDCNSDGVVDAGDFSAIVLEFFDDDSTFNWFETYTGGFAGSPRGCDSNGSENGADNSSASVTVSDIICTVLIYFGDSRCAEAEETTLQAASLANGANLEVGEPQTTDGSEAFPIVLSGGNSSIAAAGFTITYDANNLRFDDTDLNGDGIPEALSFNLPQGVEAWTQVQSGEIQVALAGLSLPLPTLSDGELATVSFTIIGESTDISIENAALGDLAGQHIGVAVNQSNRSNILYLPFTVR